MRALSQLEFYAPDQERDSDGRFGSGTTTVDPAEAFTQGASERHWENVTGAPAFRQALDSGLLADHKDAVLGYTNNDYSMINDELRGFGHGSPYALRQIELLDKVAAGTTLPEATIVLRGFAADPETLNDLKQGSIYHDNAFASTTLAAGQAKDFAVDNLDGCHGCEPVILAMHLPEGTHGFPGDSLEREWVLPRGSRFEVESHEVTQTVGKWSGTFTFHLVTARYIPPTRTSITL